MEFQAGIRLLNGIFKSITHYFPRLSLSSGFVPSFIVKMPVWLERGGKLSAVRPGMTLQAGDKLKTGLSSRLLLRMDEGSLVKLGENAQLDVDKLLPAEDKQGFFEAVLNVVKGAFRFTTTTLVV